MEVGFIGLGIMGKPMCKNLLKAGYSVVIASTNKKTNEELTEEGAIVVNSYKEIAERANIIFTMVPDSKEVKEVILGERGIIHHLRRDSIVVDMSSIAPLESQKIAKVLSEKGVRFLDAPVSGGEPKAIDGTVSFMVGGDEDTFKRCLPFFNVMGSSVVRVGDVGAGNSTKLANQIIVALNIAAVSEAFILAKEMGVDLELVYQAIRGGLAGSTVLDAKGPMMIEQNYTPGFKIDLHLKDLNNVIKTAEQLNVHLPLTEKIREALNMLNDEGYGKEDHSAIIKYFEKINKKEAGT